jgi:hypothetical protein
VTRCGRPSRIAWSTARATASGAPAPRHGRADHKADPSPSASWTTAAAPATSGTLLGDEPNPRAAARDLVDPDGHNRHAARLGTRASANVEDRLRARATTATGARELSRSAEMSPEFVRHPADTAPPVANTRIPAACTRSRGRDRRRPPTPPAIAAAGPGATPVHAAARRVASVSS